MRAARRRSSTLRRWRCVGGEEVWARGVRGGQEVGQEEGLQRKQLWAFALEKVAAFCDDWIHRSVSRSVDPWADP